MTKNERAYLAQYTHLDQDLYVYIRSSYLNCQFHANCMNGQLELFMSALADQNHQAAWKLYADVFRSWHLFLEQFFQMEHLAKYQAFAPSHSLNELIQKSGWYDKLDKEMRDLIKALDEGTLWIRYHSSSNLKWGAKHPGESLPDGLKFLNISENFVQKGVNIDATKRLSDFVFQSHKTLTSFIFDQFVKPFNDKLGSQFTDFPQQFDQCTTDLMSKLKVDRSEEKENPTGIEQTIQRLETIQRTLIGKGMEVAIHAIEDACFNLKRLPLAVRMATKYNSSHLSLCHSGNLMSIQWVIESLYVAHLYIKKKVVFLHKHNFGNIVEKIVKADIPTKRNDAVLAKYNHRLAFHYPFNTHLEVAGPLKEQFEYSRERCALPEGFKARKKGKNQLFKTLMDSMQEGLRQIALQAEDLHDALT